MNHCMVDLETTGLHGGCAILSIGAVAFTPDFKLMSTFEAYISHDESFKRGFKDDHSTIEWWERQPQDVRDKTFGGKTEPEVALMEFNDWLASMNVKFVWGNGASFDNAILEWAYNHLGIAPQWAFYNNRCYRTIKALAPEVQLTRVGQHHHAIDDALSQYNHLKLVCAKLDILI